jgi:predicted lipoprotein with Yx(FWY)xxD motif
MTRIQMRSVIAVAACLMAASVLAACGNNDSSTSTAAAAASTTTPASSGGSGDTVGVADSSLGQILVDSNGMTIYLFDKDTSGDASSCSGTCAQAWPPVTSKGMATAGSGIDASMLTTFKRDDGTTQVAFNGHPLYLYAGDSSPGDTSGNGLDQFGAEWYALTPKGANAEGGEASSSSGSDSSSSGSNSSSSGGGYSGGY